MAPSKYLLGILGGIVLAGLVAFLVLALPASKPNSPEQVRKILFENVDPKNLAENLEYLTHKPHLAGTYQDEYVLAGFIQDQFKKYLDDVDIFEHSVKLPYTHSRLEQNGTLPNCLEMLNSLGQPIFTATLDEPPKNDSQHGDLDNAPDLWLAFTPAGQVNGIPLYVNYGTENDFFELCENSMRKNFDLCLDDRSQPKYDRYKFNLEKYPNLICIFRYGKIFRGNKNVTGEKYGCQGAIIFSDPADYAQAGEDVLVYPEGPYMPKEGGERGTSYLSCGDPETPGYPSDVEMKNFRDTARFEELNVSIVGQIIGYGDAKLILQEMNDSLNLVDTPSWQGQMSDVKYATGPGFSESSPARSIEIESHNYVEQKTIRHVCGYLYGSEEPERYVIYGNHRDAWVYGAMDPNTGTAALLEAVKAFGILKNQHQYRPKRSLMFCSLAAEESGLIGSFELVEELMPFLRNQAVVYLNTDTPVNGNFTMTAWGSPHTREALISAAKLVENPNLQQKQDGLASVYDSWLKFAPDEHTGSSPSILGLKDIKSPTYDPLGSGSDFAGFLQLAGIAAVDFEYIATDDIGYPLYHSAYETFYAYSQLIDPDFSTLSAVSKIWLELSRNFADSEVLPFDINYYVERLQLDCQAWIQNFGQPREFDLKYGFDFEFLAATVGKFNLAATNFQNFIQKNMDSSKNSSIFNKKINEIYTNFERFFLYEYGVPGREFIAKHLLYGISNSNSYGTTIFPSLDDFGLETVAQKTGDSVEKIMKTQFSLVISSLKSATFVLKQALRELENS